MRFFESFLVAASAMATAAVAQSSSLYFTRVPTALTGVTAGVPFTISYVAPDNSMPVTITLRKGDPSNLATIVQLTNSATGGAFTWTPSSSLVTAGDYALDIKQGDQVNYSNQFKLLAGVAFTPSSSSIAAPMFAIPISVSSYTPISISSPSSQLTSFRPFAGVHNSSLIPATPTAAAGNGSALATPYASPGVFPVSRNATFASASSIASSTGSATMTPLAYAGSATMTGPLMQTGTNNAVARHNNPAVLILGAAMAFAYLN